ncbi:hypothetical protein RDI58_016087 [Solanum bulbocastanum]|uniref:Uncharacterized protein n=1 Tax=Solanum bulbocastanum TaxID=147425 RepID=A0AAN8TLQ7_SOLBU
MEFSFMLNIWVELVESLET